MKKTYSTPLLNWFTFDHTDILTTSPVTVVKLGNGECGVEDIFEVGDI